MESLNPDLEREINEFFDETNARIDNIFNELGFDPKQVCPDESAEFLRKRDELLHNFELFLLQNCSILKYLDQETDEVKLSKVLSEKINELTDTEEKVKEDLAGLSNEKDNIRRALDEKSSMVKEAIQKKHEIDRICNESVKEEFVRLCKFMNLKFQWCQTDQKFTIVFLSDSSDVNQVKQINSKKLLDNDEKYVKQLRDHFKIKVLQIIK